GQQYNNSPYSF
nr:immunoglobulin light chain junction region [Macaca mulatta]